MSNDLSNKCEKCANEGEIALLPCPFCNQPVTIRWNTMTGEHYISHVDLNNRCPQRPFYGNEAQWNERPAENSLRAENERLRIALNQVGNDTCENGHLFIGGNPFDVSWDDLKCTRCGFRFLDTPLR